MSKYNTFIESSNQFSPKQIDATHKELPSGAYTPFINNWGQVIFDKIKVTSDDIIDLPSKEYDYVLNQMKHFLKPETKQTFIDRGFVYKRSMLLHGRPGTGKTCLVNRITKEALKNDAVILFNPNPQHLPIFFEALESTAPNKLTLVIFEEFDNVAQQYEVDLLSILDGEIQKNNVIYLATTNYIENVSMRMQRPGRFSSIVEVHFPSAEARMTYLNAKNITGQEANHWVESTNNFSIDELKETVLAVKCLDEKLETVVARITELKERGLESESRNKSDYSGEMSFQDLDNYDLLAKPTTNYLKAALDKVKRSTGSISRR